MIFFNKLRYKNILSTGNQFTEIDLRSNKATLIIGANGQGKCLDGDTEITVKVENLPHTSVTIKDVVELFRDYPVLAGNLLVKTRFGYKPILAAAITAPNSPYTEIITTCGKSLIGSPDHLMLSANKTWVKFKDLALGDVLYTSAKSQTTIHDIKTFDDTKDLYDLHVADVHEFYANGLVSHNSTFIDALTYALYGKPFRAINKPQLINSITNKHLLVELEFTIGDHQYMVRRGMKPSVFEIHQNGKLLQQMAGARDDQQYLEENILRLNFKSFSQIVVLGSANYTPFMQLPTTQRRQVVEDLLDIQVFSVMNNLLKEKATVNRQDAKDTDYEIGLCQNKIDLHQKHVAQLKANNEELIQSRELKVVEHESSIVDHQQSVQSLMEQVEGLSGQVDDFEKVSDRKAKLLQIESGLEDRMRKLRKEVSFFHDNENCPTCKQGIDHDFRQNTISIRSGKMDEITGALSKLEDEVKATQSRLEDIHEINREIVQLNSKIQHNNQQIKFLNKYIADLNQEISSLRESTKKIHKDNEDASVLKKEMITLQERKRRIVDERAMFEVAAQLLKDGGIKAKIIKQFIPIMNKLINKYLAQMDFMCDFHLDESFNETIRSRYRDVFTHNSFSEGEKMRLNISIMLAWRAIAKIRNSAATNLLIMDEVVDGASDSNAVDAIVDILTNFDDDQNVFVISHSEKVADKFENVIVFEKHGNFSRIVS